MEHMLTRGETAERTTSLERRNGRKARALRRKVHDWDGSRILNGVPDCPRLKAHQRLLDFAFVGLTSVCLLRNVHHSSLASLLSGFFLSCDLETLSFGEAGGFPRIAIGVQQSRRSG